MRFIYKCSKCKRTVTEFEKIPVQLLPTWTCIFCNEEGTMEFQRTETKYD